MLVEFKRNNRSGLDKFVSEGHMIVDYKREEYAYTQGKSLKVNSLSTLVTLW